MRSCLSDCHFVEDFAHLGRLAEAANSKGDIETRDHYRSKMDKFISKYYPTRIGDWTTFSSGRPFWPMDPQEEDFSIEDIADGLSKTCRFNGHTKYHYSVAQHSWYVSIIVDQQHALHGLLHDASEAMLGDVITPVKRLIKDVYHPLENRLMAVVADKFNFNFDEESQSKVKIADETLLATEFRDVSSVGFGNGFVPHPPMTMKIEEWSPKMARERFLERFQELTHAGNAN